ncbi:MAG: hypothetical protein JSV58_04870 [Candidatus Bathyarchaeota archaeon]|nr:MAG: hypothetical protein JSV58_04870 [Candidatus Bathyarchaeota archaeon]
MTTWLDVLIECSKKIRRDVLPLFGSVEAAIGFGIGAGGDVMKRIDLAAEKALIDTVQNLDMSCTLISEESGVKKLGSTPADYFLTTDPVDGTTNAVRGLPFIATSIAVSKTTYLKDVEVALVSDLFHDITYTASRDGGAHKNGKAIQSSSTPTLEGAVVGVDLSAVRRKESITPLLGLLQKIEHFRHLGANALELCYVADGTTDAFVDLRGKLRVTDIAAASLILREAGGVMVSLKGEELNAPLTTTQKVSFISAANTSLLEDIQELISLE